MKPILKGLVKVGSTISHPRIKFEILTPELLAMLTQNALEVPLFGVAI
jgi:hypothetical protein